MHVRRSSRAGWRRTRPKRWADSLPPREEDRPVSAYVFILVLLALMWFMLIRPQRRRQQEAQQMLQSIGVGKEIVTAGGLYGTVTGVEDDEVRVEIADGVEVRVAKRAVAGVVSEDEKRPEKAEPEEETPATLDHS
ncbi:MAG: preprotein translocase subunit YajC [Actinobacteria bacterium]|nr:preprotein translocase subunit YajC [Actinomycetota bacterium]